MNLKQKRAIWYACQKAQEERQRKFLEENGLMEDYKKSKYRYMTNYIKNVCGKYVY